MASHTSAGHRTNDRTNPHDHTALNWYFTTLCQEVWNPDASSWSRKATGEDFPRALAERVNALLADESLHRRFGKAGRARALEHFTWTSVAQRTAALYEQRLC